MTDEQRIVADFEYGGTADDTGRVYLVGPTLEELQEARITLEVGMTLTVSDYDTDDEGNPAWVVADGTVGHEKGSDRWYLDYTVSELRYEPRSPD
ncbi:MAG: hypothetical protein ACRDNH_08175 [Gaiellaceae bacterium]